MALGADGEQLVRALGNIAQSKLRDARKFCENFSVWEGFGRLLGVARGSKNLAFSREMCSKSDFGLDGFKHNFKIGF